MQLSKKSEKIAILFDHPYFHHSEFLTCVEKLVSASWNWFFKSVISDPPNFTIENPIEVSNFWHVVSCQNYWVEIGQNLLIIFEFLSFLTYF